MRVQNYVERALEAEAQAAAATEPKGREEYLEIARLWRDLPQRRMAKDTKRKRS
jgi:hypothetical protein